MSEDNALQYVREARLIIDLYDEWLLEKCSPYIGQKIIDIGCGWGNILNHLLNYELAVGIDDSLPCILELKDRFKDYPNIAIYKFDITDPQIQSLATYKFDTAISINVFEHIEHDELAMQNVFNLLSEAGKFLLVVPAHEILYGSMDRSIGHFRRYSKDVALEKLERAGFKVVHQKYFNMVGAIGWLVSGRFLKRQVPPKGQLRIVNHLIPFIRSMESKINVPFGITLLSVGEK